jgi:hypothetical protein
MWKTNRDHSVPHSGSIALHERRELASRLDIRGGCPLSADGQ